MREAGTVTPHSTVSLTQAQCQRLQLALSDLVDPPVLSTSRGGDRDTEGEGDARGGRKRFAEAEGTASTSDRWEQRQVAVVSSVECSF
jgi:hypothetical protein